jgi:hypothetical protein
MPQARRRSCLVRCIYEARAPARLASDVLGVSNHDARKGLDLSDPRYSQHAKGSIVAGMAMQDQLCGRLTIDQRFDGAIRESSTRTLWRTVIGT